MISKHPSFQSNFRISPGMILAVLVYLGLGLFLAADNTPDELAQSRLQSVAISFYIGLGLIWLIHRRYPRTSPWLIVGMLIILPYFVGYWLKLPEILTLWVILIPLSVTMIHSVAGLTVAMSQTILLMASIKISAWPNKTVVSILLMSIWGVFGLVYFNYRLFFQLAQWSWENYEKANVQLQDALDDRLRFAQVLEDLEHANLQLTRMNRVAHGLRQAAEEAFAAKAEFVANVSHELRTPLNMITGFSETILDLPEMYGGLSSKLLADLEVIHRNAEHLSHLIDDVLDLSQIDADQMALTKEKASFHQIVAEATTAVQPLFSSKALYLKVEVPEILPPIFCDQTRIRGVLLNLLSNAGRFTEQGGVFLRVWLEKDDIRFTVTDTGPGIASDALDKIFQPFQQVDGSIRRRYGGSGLGLAISKRFIDLHRGKIWVESEPGIGTTIGVSLPVASREPLSVENWRKMRPEWEFLQRTRPSSSPPPRFIPRILVWETGQALQHLLKRYWGEMEIVPIKNLANIRQETEPVPAQALLINHISTNEALRTIHSIPDFPSGLPVLISLIPEMDDETELPGTSIHLVRPVSQENLVASLDKLNIETGTVLIVDDEPDVLQLFERMLVGMKRNFKILRAKNGEAALAILQETLPDVILLGLMMPKMDGFEFLAHRMHDTRLQTVPVIVTSARDPMGQPIVSNAVTVTKTAGISVWQLIKLFEVSGPILSPIDQSLFPTFSTDSFGELVSE